MSNNKDFKVKRGIQPTVYQEGVGTVVSGSVGYSIAGASYDSVSFSVASQDTGTRGMALSNDGTKLFTMGGSNGSVFQYSLSTAFDLSTASYDSVSFSVASQDGAGRGITFNSLGTKMYLVGDLNNSVFQYSLSTAFDLSTASYDSVSFSIASQETTPVGIAFNSSGTRLYIVGTTNDSVYQYTLSTAFDLSTASYSSVSFSVASQDTLPSGLSFNTDGSKMYIVGFTNDSVYQYTLSTAFDLSTASYNNVSFSLASQDVAPYGISFNTDGSKMFFFGFGNQAIFQYSTALTTNTLDLSSGSVFKITPTSDIEVQLSNPAASGTSSGATLLLNGGSSAGYDLGNAAYDSVSFSVAAQDATPYGMAFSTDGSKMYMVGAISDSVYQYSLSTAFDLSTVSYDSVSFSVAGQDSTPMEIAFNTDGTKMYMVGYSSDSVYQYSLSTAFDLSTVSYDSVSFSVAGQDATPRDIAFNTGGSKMYMVGNANDNVHQYSLSTAFDLSTASYDSVSFSVAGQDTIPVGIAFNTNGTKMYMVGAANDSVYQYSLSTAYDLSTASYDSVSFSVAGQDTQPYGIAFNTDGSKMYMVGVSNDSVYEYSTATPATITYPSTLKWPSGTAPTSPALGETDVITFNTTDGGTTYKSALAIDGAK